MGTTAVPSARACMAPGRHDATMPPVPERPALAVAAGLTVAALYVDPRGPYPAMPGVEAWDERRDARAYAGPHPVVAHPPCGPWGAFAHMCKNQPRDLGPLAVEQVRRWGGVLEHPARSKLWHHAGLPLPGQLPDALGGVTIEVNQVDWGHACMKPTWLYLVGVRLDAYPRRPKATPTHGIWFSSFEYAGRAGPRLKGASKEIRRRTPPEFAEFLVSLARRVDPAALAGAGALA